MKRSLFHLLRKIAFLLLLDIVSAAVAAGATRLAFYSLVSPFPAGTWQLLSASFLCTVVLSAACGLYRVPLRTVGATEALQIALAMLFSLAATGLLVLVPGWAIPLSVVLFYHLLLAAGILFSRFSFRIWRAIAYRVRPKNAYTRVMVVGAGEAGAMIVREMQTSDKVKFNPVCMIDDDLRKVGTRVSGVPVVGTRERLRKMAEEYDVGQIVIAMPSAGAATIREIAAACTETGRRVSILPGMYQILDGVVSVERMRAVNINDLLGREPVCINTEEVFGYIEGKTVLVTGGGGSIGSELCRQIAAHTPRKLVIFDIYENNAYDIQMELRRTHPSLLLDVLIGSVRDEARVRGVFEKERPDIVFHAAAHKHVPLMEDSPNEAVKNNVFGTLNVARAADEYKAQRFVMISTDKAVNPTNVMGATKRICEMIVQTMGRRSKNTEFVAVRFGNVLGSNGSVIPLFKKQIAEGGPVTVTHKDIVRYFMTIPEAVSLVLQAGAYAQKGEIFVLDMGSPVKIVTLAENLIRLSGFVPYQDIDIKFVGLRPGEKLYEERLMDEEGMQSTANKMISIGKPIELDENDLFETLEKMHVAMQSDKNDLHGYILHLVPTYHMPQTDFRGQA